MVTHDWACAEEFSYPCLSASYNDYDVSYVRPLHLRPRSPRSGSIATLPTRHEDMPNVNDVWQAIRSWSSLDTLHMQKWQAHAPKAEVKDSEALNDDDDDFNSDDGLSINLTEEEYLWN